MKELTMRERIEFAVTRSLGYDSRTNFKKGYEKLVDRLGVEDYEIKNTNEGLQAHLADMNMKTRALDLVRQKRNAGDYRDFHQLNWIDKLGLIYRLVKARWNYLDAQKEAVKSSMTLSKLFERAIIGMIFINQKVN
jgi:hypothetical protein